MASRKKHRSRPARRLVAFIDADFAKGGRVTRHQHTKGPESWWNASASSGHVPMTAH
ncbi:hypothetical protein [Streptomyces sp. NPDC059460]|uniref:hypothetical protein n=1 Tax=Streptomyces sp. NPDC059460 TaxID=3346840 RepID=UPI0036C304E8